MSLIKIEEEQEIARQAKKEQERIKKRKKKKQQKLNRKAKTQQQQQETPLQTKPSTGEDPISEKVIEANKTEQDVAPVPHQNLQEELKKNSQTKIEVGDTKVTEAPSFAEQVVEIIEPTADTPKAMEKEIVAPDLVGKTAVTPIEPEIPPLVTEVNQSEPKPEPEPAKTFAENSVQTTDTCSAAYAKYLATKKELLLVQQVIRDLAVRF